MLHYTTGCTRICVWREHQANEQFWHACKTQLKFKHCKSKTVQTVNACQTLTTNHIVCIFSHLRYESGFIVFFQNIPHTCSLLSAASLYSLCIFPIPVFNLQYTNITQTHKLYLSITKQILLPWVCDPLRTLEQKNTRANLACNVLHWKGSCHSEDKLHVGQDQIVWGKL